jgi:hypothetical protein
LSEPLIHDPGNEIEIDTLYAFLSIDAEGRHGIVAEMIPGLGTTPLVTASPNVAEKKMKPLAQEVARKTGKRVGLFRFKREAQVWWTEG